MPVEWVYVFEDGGLMFVNEEGFIRQFRDQTLPSADNPIVGRYGFWIDDLSCKINVNTASEGVYWDIPHVNSIEDRSYAQRPPGGCEGSS